MHNNFMPPNIALTKKFLKQSLQEDAPYGDITSNLLFTPNDMGTAYFQSKSAGIFCAGPIITQIMHLIDPKIVVDLISLEGQPITTGQTLAKISGSVQKILLAERITLNLLQRLCAITTTTHQFVQKVKNTNTRITDTRKTTPGLREFERYAVRCGGGFNHRNNLSETVLVKDNHLLAATNGNLDKITPILKKIKKQLSHTTHFEVEVDSIAQIEAVLAAEVDTIMLDNFSVENLEKAVKIIANKTLVEASGNITLDNVKQIAQTGVDIISSGTLTHSVKALDISLNMVKI